MRFLQLNHICNHRTASLSSSPIVQCRIRSKKGREASQVQTCHANPSKVTRRTISTNWILIIAYRWFTRVIQHQQVNCMSLKESSKYQTYSSQWGTYCNRLPRIRRVVSWLCEVVCMNRYNHHEENHPHDDTKRNRRCQYWERLNIWADWKEPFHTMNFTVFSSTIRWARLVIQVSIVIWYHWFVLRYQSLITPRPYSTDCELYLTMIPVDEHDIARVCRVDGRHEAKPCK